MDPAVVADLRLAFNAIDANGNGVLSRAEVHCYTYYGAIHTMECTPPCILYTLPPQPTPPHCPPRPITTTISGHPRGSELTRGPEAHGVTLAAARRRRIAGTLRGDDPNPNPDPDPDPNP